jgi:hypothetical protein
MNIVLTWIDRGLVFMTDRSVNCGLYIPNFGKSSDPRTPANLAFEAEKAGWDGFFLWDHPIEREQRVPITDSFIALAAVAQQTSFIRIGPFKRAARWDGVLPLKLGHPIHPKPNDLRDILSYVQKHRTTKGPFDVAIIGWGTGRNRKKNSEKITPYINAGMNWWLDSLYIGHDSADKLRKRIRMEPPGVS